MCACVLAYMCFCVSVSMSVSVLVYVSVRGFVCVCVCVWVRACPCIGKFSFKLFKVTYLPNTAISVYVFCLIGCSTSEHQTLCSLFNVRRLAVGCINHDSSRLLLRAAY